MLRTYRWPPNFFIFSILRHFLWRIWYHQYVLHAMIPKLLLLKSVSTENPYVIPDENLSLIGRQIRRQSLLLKIICLKLGWGCQIESNESRYIFNLKFCTLVCCFSFSFEKKNFFDFFCFAFILLSIFTFIFVSFYCQRWRTMQVFYFKKIKVSNSFNSIEFLVFLRNFLHVFLLGMPTKRMKIIFRFSLTFLWFAETQKSW